MGEEVIKKCVIVCASPDTDCNFIELCIEPDDYIIAADGGMELLNKAGIKPDLFVGDFDSFSGIIPEGVEIIKLNVRKDDTDSMHCAEVALERGFNEVMLLGAMGGASSHTFSNYSVMSYLADNGAAASMCDENESVTVLREGAYEFSDMNGFEFSVFPFGCGSVNVTYVGEVDYPAENLTISETSSIGKSNVFRSDDVTIEINEGKAILFVKSPDNQ